MRRMLMGFAVLLAAGETGAANAQTSVSGVDVGLPKVCLAPRQVPDESIPKPHLVSTFPAPNTVVKPGLIVLRLTFDLPMSCEGLFLAAPGLPKPCEGQTQQHIVESFDRRTIRMACALLPGVRYGFRVNQGLNGSALPVSAGRDAFKSMAGWRVEGFEVTFTTSSDSEVTTLEEAEAEDKGYSAE